MAGGAIYDDGRWGISRFTGRVVIRVVEGRFAFRLPVALVVAALHHRLGLLAFRIEEHGCTTIRGLGLARRTVFARDTPLSFHTRLKQHHAVGIHDVHSNADGNAESVNVKHTLKAFRGQRSRRWWGFGTNKV